MKKGFKANIEKETLENNDFRKVLYTAKYSQLVLMSLLPEEEIGLETHSDNDQFFRFETGEGRVVIDETIHEVKNGDVIIVPCGSKHNVINVSNILPLKFYTIYSPAHHKDKIVMLTKKEAEASKEEFDGVTSE